MDFIKKLSFREKVILGLVFLCAVGAAYYSFEYEVQQQKIASLKQKKLELDAKVGSFRAAASALRPGMMDQEIHRAQAAVVELQDEIAFLKSRMSGNSVDVVRALRRVAHENRTEFQSFDTEERRITRGQFQYRQINIRIGVVAPYTGIIDFLKSLDGIPAILSVEDLSLSRDPNLLPKVQANMTVRLFVL